MLEAYLIIADCVMLQNTTKVLKPIQHTPYPFPWLARYHASVHHNLIVCNTGDTTRHECRCKIIADAAWLPPRPQKLILENSTLGPGDVGQTLSEYT